MLGVALGVVTYAASLAAIWLLSGRPTGAERQILARVGERWHAHLAQRASPTTRS
jgi:hypothetical protein